jgi:hypothetical protein
MKQILSFLFLLCLYGAKAQQVKLPIALREISGLEQLDDDTFVAVNDGGNEAEIHVLNKEGALQKIVHVAGAENVDWEDLASDGTYLYIGDFGNNLNKRKDLCVYKVRLEAIRTQKTVEAEKISFSYADQSVFPPSAVERRYDAEGFAWHGGKLWIFTKINDEPWTGKTQVYVLPTEAGHYTLTMDHRIFIGDGGWWEDAITGVDAQEGLFYLLTYNRVLIYRIIDTLPVLLGSYHFPESTQKESILVEGNYIWVADEYQSLLGGGKMYRIPLNAFKSVSEPK